MTINKLFFFIIFLFQTTLFSQVNDATKKGLELIEKKEYKSAIEYFSEILIKNPNDYLAYNVRGSVKSRIEDHKGAIIDFNKSIKINPNYITAYNNRANSKLALKLYPVLKFHEQ